MSNNLTQNNDTGLCHTCHQELPLHESYFYKSKGKWWIYRCIECSNAKNKAYYEKFHPNTHRGRGRPRKDANIKMAKDVSLANVTDADITSANEYGRAEIQRKLEKKLKERK